MLYVQNDDAVYIWWLAANDAGFVANLHTLGKAGAMLHRTRCTHLYPPEPSKDHTGSYPKACSRDREAAERWVRNQGYQVARCSDCKP